MLKLYEMKSSMHNCKKLIYCHPFQEVVDEIRELVTVQMTTSQTDDAAPPLANEAEESINLRRKSVLLNVSSLVGGVGSRSTVSGDRISSSIFSNLFIFFLISSHL